MTFWQPSKASGPDGLSDRMLKCTAPNIAPLTKLFNLSILTGTTPLSWKKSLTVPIPKCQELSSPYNYRPVSLFPIVSKILERHIYMLLMDHLNHSHPLSALYSVQIRHVTTVMLFYFLQISRLKNRHTKELHHLLY